MTPPLSAIMVLLVCRNRRALTLACIQAIKRQRAGVDVRIALFDDASDDGTPEAVAAEHRDVTLVHGDGNAFWNGGLYRLWSRVRDEPVDAFLWLNDDTLLDDNALARMLTAWHHADGGGGRLVLAGATRGSSGAVTYAGYAIDRSPVAFRLRRILPDDAAVTDIATFNGNAVLVGRGAMAAIGLNDPAFFHNLGDIDYGLRATRAGIPVLLLPGTVGLCENNVVKEQRGYGSPLLSMREQWRRVNTHHGLPPASWWRFTRRHSGRWWPLHFALPYRHLLRFWHLSSRRLPTNA